MRRRIQRAVVLTILTVLTTTLLMYPFIVSLIQRLTRLTEDLLEANIETLKVLGSAVAKRDSDTDAHNYRVTVIAVHLAEAMGLGNEQIRGIVKGGFLHDVGKIGIPDAILLKPGRLSADEFEIMKTHVNHGMDIVKRSAWLHDAVDIVACHHEKYMGGGYPNDLKGEAITVAARIFAVADVFDALTSKRPYKEALSFDEAMRILEEGRGAHFDPEVLDRFKGIAQDLYATLAGRDDEPRLELERLTDQYFEDQALLLA